MQLSTKTQGLSIVGLTLVVIAIVYAGAPSASNPETLSDYIGYMLRVTARLSFSALLLAYIARPLVQLVGWGRPLLIQRRYIGLAAAASLTVHFGYVAAFLITSGEPLDWVTGVFGGAAFALMWAMALTSTDPARRRLGGGWKRLHITGIHYVWLIFMQTFFGVAVESGSRWAEVMATLGLVALCIRLAAWLSQRFKRTA
ncbi:MAG: ferric reductase-like transmembrane domain-containing protein [Pseudomonadales bacterium]|nr:ferric reductase-like transmembrane domain-containing protein [Pseudomonadales bacterium]